VRGAGARGRGPGGASGLAEKDNPATGAGKGGLPTYPASPGSSCLTVVWRPYTIPIPATSATAAA
jgi:hypothetical protein